MSHFLLFYDFVEDYLERRPEFRDAHLKAAWASVDRGDMVLAGALSDPADTGVLLFDSETPDAAEAFARNDPYVLNGLVKSWTVRKWTTVVGHDAATKVKV
ncbi:YciI-like protein [Asticcacaulis solisilvae]|uniref:YciI-like protein n=1 Tax=Asticcacaulis solisilvae TaxID=1217274 RepID=UPI003FD7A9D1